MMVKHKQEQYDRKIYHGLVTQLRKKNDHRYTFVIRQVHWSNKSNWEVYKKKIAQPKSLHQVSRFLQPKN